MPTELFRFDNLRLRLIYEYLLNTDLKFVADKYSIKIINTFIQFFCFFYMDKNCLNLNTSFISPRIFNNFTKRITVYASKYTIGYYQYSRFICLFLGSICYRIKGLSQALIKNFVDLTKINLCLPKNLVSVFFFRDFTILQQFVVEMFDKHNLFPNSWCLFHSVLQKTCIQILLSLF